MFNALRSINSPVCGGDTAPYYYLSILALPYCISNDVVSFALFQCILIVSVRGENNPIVVKNGSVNESISEQKDDEEHKKLLSTYAWHNFRTDIPTKLSWFVSIKKSKECFLIILGVSWHVVEFIPDTFVIIITIGYLWVFVNSQLCQYKKKIQMSENA